MSLTDYVEVAKIKQGDRLEIEGGDRMNDYVVEGIATRDCYDIDGIIYVVDEDGPMRIRGDLCTRICVNGVELLPVTRH